MKGVTRRYFKLVWKKHFLATSALWILVVMMLIGLILFENRNKKCECQHPRNIYEPYVLDKVNSTSTVKDIAVLVAVSCGTSREEELFLMIKSAAFLAKKNFHLILFIDDTLFPHYDAQLLQFPLQLLSKFTYELRLSSYPDFVNTREWRHLFAPCSSLRIFFPLVLPEFDSIIYVDSDTLFLRPLEELWSYFSLMNDSMLAAMAPEHESPEYGYYNKQRTPHYGELGLNSGVMLMNLTRMRETLFTSWLLEVNKKYRSILLLPDQDIYNIIFCCSPELLYELPCEWNFRKHHCEHHPVGICNGAELEGVSLAHGTYFSFNKKPHPVFKLFYDSWANFNVTLGLQRGLIEPFRQNLLDIDHRNPCFSIADMFIKSLEKQ